MLGQLLVGQPQISGGQEHDPEGGQRLLEGLRVHVLLLA